MQGKLIKIQGRNGDKILTDNIRLGISQDAVNVYFEGVHDRGHPVVLYRLLLDKKSAGEFIDKLGALLAGKAV